MFHRFHDLKTGQEADMVGNNSRSSTPSEVRDERALFPPIVRPDLAPPSNQLSNQLRVNPQYPISSSSGSGYASQGASLMSLGHNLMFPPGKLLPTPTQEAHRYMTEAYRLAAGELEHSGLLYGSSGRIQNESQHAIIEAHKSSVDLLSGPTNSRSHGVTNRPQGLPDSPHPLERNVYNPINLTPQVSSDLPRIDSTNPPRGITEHPFNVSKSPTKVENESANYSKNTYPVSSSDIANINAAAPPKTVSPPPSSVSSPPMFTGPFTPAYEQFSDGSNGNYKHQYYDDGSVQPKRETVSVPPSGVESVKGPTSQGIRSENASPASAGDQVQEAVSFNRGCLGNSDMYDRDEPSGSADDSETASHLSLDLLNRATTSHGSIIDRAKMIRGRHMKDFRCDLCDIDFKNATQLKNHTWRHTGEKPFSCDECQATFTQQSNLKTHLRIHTGERPYKCEECEATFTQISNLRTHQKIHTGEKPYECDVCFVRFSQQSNLKSHKLIHTGERPFTCDECGATFVQSTHLRNHKRIHTDERPYTCEQCGAKFRQLSNLKTHEKIHTGERPHVCEDCGSAFAQKSNLKSHMLKLHSNDGSSMKKGRKKKLEAIVPFICEECGAKFTMMSNLKIHMRLHTGVKPYECSVCSASFAQRSNLKSHEQIHTDERPFKCNECPAGFRQKTNLKTHKMKKHPVKSLKIKILSDTQYVMQDLMHDIIQNEENDGEGPSQQHIEEPIVQINEGQHDNMMLGGNDGMIKAETGERYDHHSAGEPFQGSNMFRHGNMAPPELNPYDSAHF